MSRSHEIQRQIRNVQRLQRVMRSMQLVAMAKRRRCTDRMLAGRPYAAAIRHVARHVVAAHSEFRHPLLDHRDDQRAGYIVVTSDRGLCGGLNHRLLTRVNHAMDARTETTDEIPLGVFGKRGMAYFRRRAGRVLASANNLADAPAAEALTETIRTLIDEYAEGRIDRLFLAFNRFENVLHQKPMIVQLLPVLPIESDDMPHTWDYIYEPESIDLIDAVLRRYIHYQIYQAVLENRASEMTARATAMQKATDNAANRIKKLTQIRHKLRQAAITQEIQEIMAGCEATSG
ncbi:ATP synthase F1 subunit gamma [Salinisphaera hydrothermalis]|uniref:ATP synthase gamma chain n=1 Tax=Salinisphaera hydrothermalis (strain C41B8) TaxID=1304275 RepID=A0A084IKJ4_SALHC|nr:ATP synthase F1 subunit gamma [Salinisphaera hydrothermalis]KEZ77228.1 H(+)-transporting two-sector ATPase [Salinisphaera hydrothermalis C41B8]